MDWKLRAERLLMIIYVVERVVIYLLLIVLTWAVAVDWTVLPRIAREVLEGRWTPSPAQETVVIMGLAVAALLAVGYVGVRIARAARKRTDVHYSPDQFY